MLQRQVGFFLDEAAPPPPPAPTPRHSFTMRAGGTGSRGYNGPGGFGSFIDGTTGTYTLPSGRSTTVQHCRFVRDILNYALIPQDLALDQFPATIVLANTDTNQIITAKRPGTTTNIGGNTITRADYTVATADEQVTRDGFAVQTAFSSVLVANNDIDVELYD